MWLPPATALWVVFGFATVVYANDALATFSPCPECPNSIMPMPITITAQYQTVSTCTPQETCTSTTCHLEPSCSTYDWVSTTVPCLGGATSTLITKTDEVLELSHVSTVLTSYSPCTTTAHFSNGTTPSNSTAPLYNNQTSCTSTAYHTMVVDISAPFDECGPLAIGGWNGSGLCNACVPNADTELQVVDVDKCLDGICSTYKETWVSTKPTTTPSSSVSTTPYSTSYSLSSGMNTIPITATFSPSQDTGYTAPVTSTFSVTTSVPSSQVVDFTTYITVTFTAGPALPAVSSSLFSTPVVTSTSLSTNGVYTIPITKAFTPTGSGFTEPVTATAYYTTSINVAPTSIEFTTTITVTFTSTVYPIQTIVSGTTFNPTAPASAPAESLTLNPSPSSTSTLGEGLGSLPFSATLTSSQNPISQSATSALGEGSGSGTGSGTFTSSQGLSSQSTTSALGEGSGSGSSLPPFSTTFTSSQGLSSQNTTSVLGSGSGSLSFSATPSSSQSLTSPSLSSTSLTGISSISTMLSASTTGGSSSGGPTGAPSSTMGGVSSTSGELSSTTASGSSSITSGVPSTTPSPPPVVGTFEFVGCVGSTNGFPTFSLAESSSSMSVDLCLGECAAAGELYAGLYSTDCYCASTLDSGTSGEVTTGVCDIPCPGNPQQSCGGRVGGSSKLRRRIANGILLDVYENSAPTTTSSSSTETSSTTSSTPDASSDPDPEPEKRDIQAEMEISHHKARNDGKLRRGGMLQIAKPIKGPALAKRDYGIKAPFGS